MPAGSSGLLSRSSPAMRKQGGSSGCATDPRRESTEEGRTIMKFSETRPELLSDNPFRLIGADWMLITAGSPDAFNTMTASWGGLGVLWERKVAFCFIRPTRHTYGFIERAGGFTLSFFGEQYRSALQFCGTHSGRDTDKVSGAGLTPVR